MEEEEESEEVTMIMAADFARHRRTDDVKRRHFRPPAEDKSVQTEMNCALQTTTTSSTPLSRDIVTILCYMSFALVIANLAELKLLVAMGSTHRNYTLIFGLLLSSLCIQCALALFLIQITRRDLGNVPEVTHLTLRGCSILKILISIVTFINISVFVFAT